MNSPLFYPIAVVIAVAIYQFLPDLPLEKGALETLIMYLIVKVAQYFPELKGYVQNKLNPPKPVSKKK